MAEGKRGDADRLIATLHE